MPTLLRSKSVSRAKSLRKRVIRSKKTFKLQLTPEDIAPDNAISAAAESSLLRFPKFEFLPSSDLDTAQTSSIKV